jgi:hypothetical protein
MDRFVAEGAGYTLTVWRDPEAFWKYTVEKNGETLSRDWAPTERKAKDLCRADAAVHFTRPTGGKRDPLPQWRFRRVKEVTGDAG